MARRELEVLVVTAALLGAACGERATEQPAPPGPQGPPGVAPVEPSEPRFQFGTPGPWPVQNVTYGAAEGIRERPVVGITTDESQNRWIATHEALYLLRPGETAPRRYDAADGLHLPGNPVFYCDDRAMRPGEACNTERSSGEAAPPGISKIVGGGADEVFVGYFGHNEMPPGLTCPPKDPTKSVGFGDYCDPNRHSGKVDRVRLLADGSLEVERFDFAAVRQGGEYWHNRTVRSLLYDHHVHPHTLYVGMNHGVNLVFPDRFRRSAPGEWFDLAYREWMGDHLHARVCKPGPCPTVGEGDQRMGGWNGLALDANGDLWHAGRWTAGLITWTDDPVVWFERNGRAFKLAFGDPYPEPPNDEGFTNEPVFKVTAEGDPVNLSGVAVCPDGRVWFSSSGPATGTDHTVAVWRGRSFATFPATRFGLADGAVSAIACLPDGRVVLAGARSGLAIHDPAKGTSRVLRAGAGIPGDEVLALEVDRMVNPPALHVATRDGAAVLRVIP